MPAELNNTLVALLPSPEDFQIARDQHWYRIPLRVKRAPRVLSEGRLQFLAFYHPKVFGFWAYSVRYVAAVKSISIVTRKDLVPFPENPAARAQWLLKAEEKYYKIEISPLQELPLPIVSRKFRRIVFLETTDHRLFNAKEINDLFQGNELEEQLYNALKSSNIPVERQFHVQVQKQHCFLDFAVFCQKGKINIECDGGYHYYKHVQDSDRGRNNFLQSNGWSVLRFSEEDVCNNINDSMALVAETIGQYGGLHHNRLLQVLKQD